jgi:hypothetical protein
VAWPDEPADGIGLMACAGQHTDDAQFCPTAWDHPLHPAVINAAARQVLGIARNEGDHPVRHPDEGPDGQVHPVTLNQHGTRGMPPHRTIRPDKAAPARSQSREPNGMICAVASACR